MAMSEDTYERTVVPILERFKEAARLGKIQSWDQCWSPEDTLTDCRYMFHDVHGEKQILLHREVRGYLDALGV